MSILLKDMYKGVVTNSFSRPQHSWDKALMMMMKGVVTNVRTNCGGADEFPVTRGLHQRSALSSYLFTLTIDKLIVHIQEEVPWCILFEDDIVSMDESRDGINVKLERWRKTLESKGFKICTKTKYVDCNFSGDVQRAETIVRVEVQEIPQRDSFQYLGSLIS